MAVHWVNYDLNRPGQNYPELIEYLKSHSSWAKPLKSSFFVETAMSASNLCEGIMKHVDKNDAVVVVPVDGKLWASYGIPEDVTAWMQEHI